MADEVHCDLHNITSPFYLQNRQLSSQFFDCSKGNATLTPFALCEYVKNQVDLCEGGGYIDWTRLQLCTYDQRFIQVLYILGAIFFFVFLFILISTTADQFFCSNIAAIVSFHKISQNFAGITFMAFANGAPDIFTSIASVVSANKPQTALAISELLGGCIFVTTVVVSAIAFMQPFEVMRRPVIRDIVFFIFPIVILFFSVVFQHSLTLLEPMLFLIIYAIYVFVVLSGSFVHKRMSKRKRRSQKTQEAIIQVAGFTPQPVEKHKRGRTISSSQSTSRSKVAPVYGLQKLTVADLITSEKENIKPRGDFLETDAQNYEVEKSTMDVTISIETTDTLYNSPNEFSQSSPMKLITTANKISEIKRESSEESDEPPASSYITAGKFFGKEQLDDECEDFVEDTTTTSGSLVVVPTALHNSEKRLSIDAKLEERRKRVSVSSGFSFGDKRQSCSSLNNNSCTYDSPTNIFWQLVQALSPINSKKFFKASYMKQIFFIIRSPCIFLLKLTVPLADSPWCKVLVMLQSFTIPFLFLFSFQSNLPLSLDYIGHVQYVISEMNNAFIQWTLIIFCFGVLPSVLCLIIFFATSFSHSPKYYPIIAAYIGFIASVAWIYWAAAEIVNIVITFGNILGISYQLLGMTAVAWSNCICDLIADISVARNGFPRMAFSAAIGGPLFNVLIGFGLTFTISTIRSGKIKMDDKHTLYVNIIMLVALSICLLFILIMLFVQKFHIGRANAIFLICLYIAFLTAVISVIQLDPIQMSVLQFNPCL